jgi:hypothetical protein
VRERGEPILTTGEKAWHSVYSVELEFLIPASANLINQFLPFKKFKMGTGIKKRVIF